MAHVITTQIHNTKFHKFAPIQWLLRRYAGYCDAQKLKNTEDFYLEDMGITRKQANQITYR